MFINRQSLRQWYYCALGMLGYFESLSNVDLARVGRFVFICTGNICRSPYAEHRMRALGAQSVSCGLRTQYGYPADWVARKIAKKRGIDLDTHRTRRVEDIGTSNRDLVVVMEPWHFREAVRLTGVSGAQVTLLGLWGERCRPVIDDPFGRPEGSHETCFRWIDESLDGLVHQYREAKVQRGHGGFTMLARTRWSKGLNRQWRQK
jgi:protein-tyrosine phosphatase